MGGYTSKLPIKSKFTIGEENDRIKYAATSMQGWRPKMEDFRTTILDLDGSNSTSFFGVYDGHGGSNVASYCGSQFHVELTRDDDYHNNMANALRHVFFRIDEQLKEVNDWRESVNPRSGFDLIRCVKETAAATFWFLAEKQVPYNEGSTATVALIVGNQIIVGNVGDSRCVLAKDGQAIDLSIDHKPKIPAEARRIRRAGGQIIRDRVPRWVFGKLVGVDLGPSRVNGVLGMSRAIGDFAFKNNKDLPAKEQMVTCNPTIRTATITEDTDFMIIASDGVWDAATSTEVVNFVRDGLQSRETDLCGICERLVDHCLISRDNVTVILIQFKHGPVFPPLPAAPLPTVVEEEEEDLAGSDEIVEVNEDEIVEDMEVPPGSQDIPEVDFEPYEFRPSFDDDA